MAYTTTALILESNGEVFLRGNNVLKAGNDIGKVGLVPTPDGGGSNEGDFWATPINDEGAVTGIQFQPYNLLDNSPVNQPKPYSLPATKIRVMGVLTNGKPDYYFVLGTSAQWAAASLPDATSLVYWPQSQRALPTGVLNTYAFTLGVPSLAVGQTLFFKGWINGVALAAASAGGYANISELLVFLNANVNTYGSPAISVVWTSNVNGSAVIGTITIVSSDVYSVPDQNILDASVWAINP